MSKPSSKETIDNICEVFRDAGLSLISTDEERNSTDITRELAKELAGIGFYKGPRVGNIYVYSEDSELVSCVEAAAKRINANLWDKQVPAIGELLYSLDRRFSPNASRTESEKVEHCTSLTWRAIRLAGAGLRAPR